MSGKVRLICDRSHEEQKRGKHETTGDEHKGVEGERAKPTVVKCRRRINRSCFGKRRSAIDEGNEKGQRET